MLPYFWKCPPKTNQDFENVYELPPSPLQNGGPMSQVINDQSLIISPVGMNLKSCINC